MPTGRIAGILVFGLCAAQIGLAQQPPAAAPAGRGTPPAPRNLQVLKAEEVGPAMRAFTAALQVQCSYCHVTEPARDFASDEKQTKKTARLMLQMVNHVNEMIATGVGKPAGVVTKVQCATCHRGKAIPETPELTPPAPAAAPAPPR